MRFRVIRKWEGYSGVALNNLDQMILARQIPKPTFETDNEYVWWEHKSYHLWDGKEMRDLPERFRALDLNDRLDVVGEFKDQAALFRKGELTILGPGQATSVNNEGTIVGAIQVGERHFPCCWKDGTIVWRGERPGIANAINSRGDFVGVISGFGFDNAFACESGQMRVLAGPKGQAEKVFANDINDDGLIVGGVEGPLAVETSERCLAQSVGYIGLLWEGELVREIPRPERSGGITPLHIGAYGLVTGESAQERGDSANRAPEAFVSLDGESSTLVSTDGERIHFDDASKMNVRHHILVTRHAHPWRTYLVRVLDGTTHMHAPEVKSEDANGSGESSDPGLLTRLSETWSRLLTR